VNGFNLGWAPELVAQDPAQTVQVGLAVQPGHTEATDAVPANGQVGLEQERVLAWAEPGHGLGTAVLDALLELVIPTSAPPDTYSTVLTITVI